MSALRFLPYFILIGGFAGLRFLGFDGFFGQDSYEYLRITRNIMAHFQLKEPLVSSVFPPGFPIFGALAGLVLSDPALGLSLVALGFSLGSIALFRALLEQADSASRLEKDLFTVLFLAISPLFLKSSQVAMSDAQAIFLILALFWVAINYADTPRFWKWIPAALLAAFAISTRIATLVLLPFPVFFMVWISLKNRSYVGMFLGLLVFGLSTYSLFQISGFLTLTSGGHPYSPDHWNLLHWFGRGYDNQEGTAHYVLPNILFVSEVFWHRAFQFLGGIYLVISLLKLRNGWNRIHLLWIPVLAYLLFLAGIEAQNERYLLLVFPMVGILLFPGFCSVWRGLLSPFRERAFILLALFIPLFLAFRTMRGPFELSVWEKQLAQDLAPYKQRKIYSFSVDVALKQRLPEAQFFNLWEKKYSDFDRSALVLFNEKAFNKEWEGRTPMLNWQHLKKSRSLVLVKRWPDGWELYEID